MSDESSPNQPDAAAVYSDPFRLERLSDLQHVRKRPGMYIGSTTIHGLHHLAEEIIANSIQEFWSGSAKSIRITLHCDGAITIADDGSGIPFAPVGDESHPDRRQPAIERILTDLKFAFDKSRSYRMNGGLHGVGMTVVNFLSERMRVEVNRDGQSYRQIFSRGVAASPVVTDDEKTPSGTSVTFLADSQVMQTIAFDYERLHQRVRDLAFLNHGLTIDLSDERSGQSETFLYPNGLADYVALLTHSEQTIHHNVLHYREKIDDHEVELAMQFAETKQYRSFANSIVLLEDGSPTTGFRTGLTRSLNRFACAHGLLDEPSPTYRDYMNGLCAAISLRLPNAEWRGPTRTCLNNPEATAMVRTATDTLLARLFKQDHDAAIAIVRRAVSAASRRCVENKNFDS